MKYKVLRSAAFNFAHSFSSHMNVAGDRSTMDFLAYRAVKTNTPELQVDLLRGKVEPDLFDMPVVSPSIRAYIDWFSKHLANFGVDLIHIHDAHLSLTFGFTGTVASQGGAPPWTVPFECSVSILDDRGKAHVGRVRDFWHVAERPPIEA